MFAINHAATALVIKKHYPEAPLSLLLISVQLMELLWVGFNFAGIEYSTTEATVTSVLDVHLAHIPYSHSILSTLVVASLAWLIIRKGFNKPVIAVATAIAIASHVLLDVLTHSQDIPLTPFTEINKVGLGLYAVPLAAFVVETTYGILCWWIYRGSMSLLAIIVGFNLANITFFSAAIPGPEALLADNPVLLTTVVLVQIVLTLVLVNRFSDRQDHIRQVKSKPTMPST
ncbi:MAG: hypothetical protein JMN27_16990 [gamma proteobacterium endosymbiont of Lamellibrachia anaximandri]|nr:hypothetical protein [gamma proteobacterium endosymbiont of Lamellibrachia anaximandri]MBL3535502.1 hypothetical protein [gamma proteobacterium endosymbiont of Lamellibrachia anaximandri]